MSRYNGDPDADYRRAHEVEYLRRLSGMYARWPSTRNSLLSPPPPAPDQAPLTDNDARFLRSIGIRP